MNGHKETALIRQEIIDLAKKPINLETLKGLRINSYERSYLIEFLDDEAFDWYCQNNLNNHSPATSYPTTYEETCCVKLFPELLTRFNKLRQKVIKLKQDAVMEP